MWFAPYDVVLADDVTVQPDLVYVVDADRHRITEANLQGPPTVAVEVVSDPRHHLVRKRELYARYGVAEYWVVQPDLDRIEVFRLADGLYPKPDLFEPGDTLTTRVIPGLQVDVGSLLAE